ncbi:MAG: FHA domain-containing protein [Alkalispirochaeta sp.]
MSTGLRRVIVVVLGLLAGVTAWPLLELLLLFQESFPGYFLFSLAQGALFGVVLGLFFGSGEGLTSKDGGKLVRGAMTGALVGLAGGMIGFTAGQGVLFFIIQRTSRSFAVPLARAVGWAILGLSVGMAEGIRAKSGKKSAFGALGGVLGGLLGGIAIEYLRGRFPGMLYGRLVGFLLFGGLIGVFYALLERRFSFGVLRLLNGTLRGKEYSFSQSRISVGSDPKNDIVLKGYDNVRSRHALFRVKRRDVYLSAVGEDPTLLVNEEPVTGGLLLKYEDVVQVGSAKMFFKGET